jgi:mannose-1-phosphate guanylyltransferase
MKNNVFAIIMAGGKGERFWPLSTLRNPKQTLKLFTGKPMLATAVERVQDLIPSERVLVITSKDLVAVTRRAVPCLPAGNVIGEPSGRDTAAACAVGTALAKSRHHDAVCCVLTADHIIRKVDIFKKILRAAIKMASEDNSIITLGIKPSFPSTGFGYIKTARKIKSTGGIKFVKAERFVEKPDLAKAREYVANGKYYWNSGMFIWSAKTFFEALRVHAPSLLKLAGKIAVSRGSSAVEKILNKEYPLLQKISVDYAIMEKSGNIVTAETDIGWNDIGSWSALAGHFQPDRAGNVVLGKVEALESSGNIIVSQDRLTALIDVQDLIVVQAAGVTMICRKESAQKVKDMVKQLSAGGGYKNLL